MRPSAFEFRRAGSLEEAAGLLRANPEAKLLAGGQSLVAAMKLRLASPTLLVALAGLPELDGIKEQNGALVIGAGVTHCEVAASPIVCGRIPALAHLAGGIGDAAVRHLGTLGGAIANNDPAADYPAAVLGLAALLHTNKRIIAADDFFVGMFATALEPDEIVTAVAFPIPKRAAYRKFPQAASRFATAGAFVAETATGPRVAITGAASCVFRAAGMEAALARQFSPEAIRLSAIDPADLTSDIHGDADYRAAVAAAMARRAVADTVAVAQN